ncbi:MAG: hypothetical protein AVDCRST_MAG52-1570, partial [uncultured Blastococcus sp.]
VDDPHDRRGGRRARSPRLRGDPGRRPHQTPPTRRHRQPRLDPGRRRRLPRRRARRGQRPARGHRPALLRRPRLRPASDPARAVM